MKKRFNQVYQFKITLKGVRPPIWRRIQVPETYTFWDLHCAIQNAMGWTNSHLHEFEMVNPSTGKIVNIGEPDEEFKLDRVVLAEERQKIDTYFTLENRLALYTYDFGDNWEHTIQLEKILPREQGVDYPGCIAGKRACPPDDCGGVWGYSDLLKILKNPGHKEYKEMLEWVGEDFDPEAFDVFQVSFFQPSFEPSDYRKLFRY